MTNRTTTGAPSVYDEATAPGYKIEKITASDTVDFVSGRCRALLVGTAGAASLIDGTGTERDAVPLQQGYNPIEASRILATGLTAANIWAIY